MGKLFVKWKIGQMDSRKLKNRQMESEIKKRTNGYWDMKKWVGQMDNWDMKKMDKWILGYWNKTKYILWFEKNGKQCTVIKKK